MLLRSNGLPDFVTNIDDDYLADKSDAEEILLDVIEGIFLV